MDNPLVDGSLAAPAFPAASHLQALVESSDDAILGVDRGGIVRSWNPGAERLYGYTAAEVLGRPLATLVPPERAAEVADHLARLYRGETLPPYETVRTRRDGRPIDVFVRLSPIRGEAGQIVGAVIVARDFTERKRIERYRLTRLAVTQILAQASSLVEASPRILQAVCEGLGWDAGALWDVEGDWLRCQEFWHGPALPEPSAFEVLTRQQIFPPGEGLPGRVWVSLKACWIEDVTCDLEFPRAAAAGRDGLHAAFACPMRFESEMLGVIEFFSREVRGRDDGLLEMMSGIGEQVGQFLQRRRAEDALRASEAQLRFVTDHAATLLAHCDRDRRFRFVNRGYAERFGLTPEEVIGKHVAEVVGPAAYSTFRPYIDMVLQGRRVEFEVEVTYERQGRCFVRSAYVPDTGPDGGVIGWIAASTDISERKRMEDRLRENEHKVTRLLGGERRRGEQLRKLAEASLAIHSALSLERVLQVVTDQARRIIGAHQAASSLEAESDRDLPLHTVSLSDEQARWPDAADIRAQVCSSNRPLRLSQAELEAHPAWQALADGPPLVRGWLAAPFVGRDGRNLGLIQLTDRHEGEFSEDDEAILQQLAAIASVAIENAWLVERLRDADRRKDEFLAMLAHELRNPLAPIRNALEVLRRSGPAASQQRARDMMERQVQALVRLVDDLLDMSRIMRGKIELRKAPVDLATVLARAVETSQPLLDAEAHQLMVMAPGEPLWLQGDLVRLAQVVSNLLNNAARYTERGGRVWLSSERDGAQAVIRVRDTGVGIAPEMLPRIFDLFFQADRRTRHSQGGMGIGLTLVRNLVGMHGGTVEARSEGPGRGSEFVVRLPLLDLEGPAPAVEELPRRHAPARRILVVDDNVDAAESLSIFLQLGEHEVQVACDGAAALEMARARVPQVAFLDIGMPGMDGYEVARRFRAEPALRQVFLVALTGWGQEEDRRRTREAGFDEHLVKPVEPAALEALLSDPRLPQPVSVGTPTP